MDQFVQREVGSGRLQRWLSVSLDGLDFDEIGSAEEITHTEVCEVLETALQHTSLSHVLISKAPLEGRLERWVTGIIDTSEQKAVIDNHLVFEQTESGVSAQLQAMWKDFFGQADLSDTSDFFEIGGDSLKALTMLSRIHKTFGVDMSIRDFYDHPVLSTQGLFIHNRLGDAGIDQITGRSAVIPSAGGAGLYALSAAQRRMYFLHAFDKAALTYNMPHVIRLEGMLDAERLRTCFEQLIARHEILRTSFELHEGEVKQRVHETIAGFEWTIYESDAAGVSSLVDQFIRPFDLGHAPLLRAGLIRIGEAAHVLLVDMHHVVTDGVSTDILVNDFSSLYRGAELPALHLQYKDYAQWQQSAAEQIRISAQKAFWMKQYQDLPDPLALPVDFSRPLIKSTVGAILKNKLTGDTVNGLKRLAEQEKVSMFMLLLSIYHVLLSKLSSQEDIVIGTPTAGRLHADLERVMGMFVNTLPLRNSCAGEDTFQSFLQRIKENTLSCFDNQEYQYEDIVESLGVARDMSRNPLFDVMFSYENFEDVDSELEGLKLTAYEKKHDVSKFDMTLIAAEEADGISLNIEYNTILFKEDTIIRMVAYLKRIAAIIVKDAGIRIKDIELLDETEREILLGTFNSTESVYPSDKTIVDLFRTQVTKTPDEPALIFGSDTMSYRALDLLSTQISIYLCKDRKVSAGDKVAIMLERSIYLIPVLLGILKSGAAYVPIDPSYPVGRVEHILQDGNILVMIDNENVYGIVQQASLYNEKEMSYEGPTGSDLAYVIYTSGSTGQPKGVMIEHRSLVNRLWWMQQQYPIGQGDVILQKTPVVFDVSLWELFWWSFTGASLYLLPPGGEKDPEMIKSAITAAGVTTLHFVPSMFEAFLLNTTEDEVKTRLKTLRRIFCSGEALKVEQVNKFRALFTLQKGTDLINLYGPTEATVDVSWYNCDWSIEQLPASIPIGKPIANTALYILDKYGRLSPIGVAGELYIGGVGVGRGYLNNEALTSERFISNPFKSGDRIYRTGDLARWMPDGNIEYLGRLDDQIKLRGLRIELGEITYQLSGHKDIQQSIAVIKERAGSKYIVGYYTSEIPIAVSTFKEYLSTRLPDYMIPSYFIKIDTFPLTTNGKLNKKALPDPEIQIEKDSYVPPANELQKSLVKIWAAVLAIDEEKIGIDTNFFELGGHSMDVINACNEINTAFNTNLSVATFFEFPLVSKMAKYLSGKVKEEEQENIQYLDNEMDQMHLVLGAINRS
ncbi:non-ribosomal peptide synthetase [Chitinophaga sp. MD30]|uniref:non-ribosomal peptide synthetase n=2 Tax=Chitinophaga TaxID=79328 RepID=UPI000BB0848A|nr:non-ribosomal peptide synthetase [Chitinophaga sp. MD30]ASZ13664.1 hypothetical protein CK934_23270 [Chitinophaga sp. MD30]